MDAYTYGWHNVSEHNLFYFRIVLSYICLCPPLENCCLSAKKKRKTKKKTDQCRTNALSNTEITKTALTVGKVPKARILCKGLVGFTAQKERRCLDIYVIAPTLTRTCWLERTILELSLWAGRHTSQGAGLHATPIPRQVR